MRSFAKAPQRASALDPCVFAQNEALLHDTIFRIKPLAADATRRRSSGRRCARVHALLQLVTQSVRAAALNLPTHFVTHCEVPRDIPARAGLPPELWMLWGWKKNVPRASLLLSCQPEV